MINIRIPRDPSIATKFFAQFTAKDLVRLALPAVAAYLMAGSGTTAVGAAAVGLGVGVIWYRWRPHGKPIDQLVTDTIRWTWNAYSEQYTRVYDITQNEVRFGSKNSETGTMTGYIYVEPVNLSLLTEQEQSALHSQLQHLYETIDYPIKIHLIQDRAGIHVDRAISRDALDEAAVTDVADSYESHLDTLTDDGIDYTAAFITVSTPVSNRSVLDTLLPWRQLEAEHEIQSQAELLEHRLNEVYDAVDSAQLDAQIKIGDELEGFMNLPLFKPSTRPTYTKVGDTFARTAVIESYPETVELGWSSKLLEDDGHIEVTQVVEPADPGDTISQLNRAVEKLSAEIGSWLQAGYLGTTDLEARLDDAEWMLERFTARDDKPVKYKAYVTARGDTEEECKEAFDAVTSKLDMLQFEYRLPVMETSRTRNAISPVRDARDAATDVMPSSSAAAGFPFNHRPIPESNGVMVGRDVRDDIPVFVDRFAWKAPHMVRLGATGSGKSYATKLELLRSAVVFPQCSFIVVDPKKEYDGIVQELGGAVYEITEEMGVDAIADQILASDSRFAVLQPANRTGSETDAVLVDIVRAVYQVTSSNEGRSIVFVDESHRLLNHSEEGEQLLSTFVREARDTATGVTLISQNASDFTASTEGRALLDNVETTILMQHERVSDSIVDYFNMSHREAQNLFSLKTGTDCGYSEALVKVSNRRNTKIKVKASDQEHAVIAGGGDDA